MSGVPVGVVASLHRYPVKSMLGEELEAAVIGRRGLRGDRQYALRDTETGKVVSVKRPRWWGRTFELTATTGDDGVQVAFADGVRYPIESDELPGRLSSFFGRAVTVRSAVPAGTTFDEVWRGELKRGARPYYGMPSRYEDGDELIDQALSHDVPGGFFNHGAVHVVTRASAGRLSSAAPRSDFDPTRFRPNVVVETDEEGFVETAWQGRVLTIGDVRLDVTFTVPRCVMTTLRQGRLPADPDVLRTIARANMVEVDGTAYPCVGVYAQVTSAGVVRRGDRVLLW